MGRAIYLKKSEVMAMAMKSISEEMHGVDKGARAPGFDWELARFVLALIALVGFVYGVHLLIQMW